MKKSAKKPTRSASKAKVSVKTKVVARPVSVARKGYSHSSVLSDQVLMLLAIFFALVGLFAILMYRQQNEEMEAWSRQREARDAMMYAPSPRVEETSAPKMNKY